MIDGNFTAESIVKGIKEDSVYLDFEGAGYEIPAEVMAAYEEAIEAIKSGEIVVPTTIDEAKAWVA